MQGKKRMKLMFTETESNDKKATLFLLGKKIHRPTNSSYRWET